jgi:uncharacterized membrane protein
MFYYVSLGLRRHQNRLRYRQTVLTQVLLVIWLHLADRVERTQNDIGTLLTT